MRKMLIPVILTAMLLLGGIGNIPSLAADEKAHAVPEVSF